MSRPPMIPAAKKLRIVYPCRGVRSLSWDSSCKVSLVFNFDLGLSTVLAPAFVGNGVNAGASGQWLLARRPNDR